MKTFALALRVVGLDDAGGVVLEENGIFVHTNEPPERFVEWYGLRDMRAEERAAIGIKMH